MNNRPSSVTALPDFTCQRSGWTKETNIDGKAVNAVCMKVKKSSDPRVLSGSTFLLADSPTAIKPEVRFIRKRAAVTLRLNPKREKKLSEGEILVMDRTVGIVTTEQNVYQNEGGEITTIPQAQAAIITATVLTAMKSLKFRGKTTHAAACIVDGVDGLISIKPGDKVDLTVCHHNWMKSGGYPRLKPGQAVKLKVIPGVNPCVTTSRKGITHHEARLIMIPAGFRYSHDRAAELLEVMQ
ncbi:hypothetical protein LL364_001045 [Citrobacter freundii]|nr:hypothetical protein [Citrobacter freundii]